MGKKHGITALPKTALMHSARAQTPQLGAGDEEDGTSAEAQERARREREKERRMRTPEIVAQVSSP